MEATEATNNPVLERYEKLMQWREEKKKLQEKENPAVKKELPRWTTPLKTPINAPQTSVKPAAALSRMNSNVPVLPSSLAFATPMRPKPNEKFATPLKQKPNQPAINAVPKTPMPAKAAAPAPVPATPAPSSKEHTSAQSIIEDLALAEESALSMNDFDALVQSLKGIAEHTDALKKCEFALANPDYDAAHKTFVDLYSDATHGEWVRERAFFWLYWAKLQEQFSLFDRAGDLYQQAVEHRAVPVALIAAQLKKSAQLHRAAAAAATPKKTTKPITDPVADELAEFEATERAIAEEERKAAILKEAEETAKAPVDADERKSRWDSVGENVNGSDRESASPSKRKRLRSETPSRLTAALSPLGKAERVVRPVEADEVVVPYRARVQEEIKAGASYTGANVTEAEVRRVFEWLSANPAFAKETVASLAKRIDEITEPLTKSEEKAEALSEFKATHNAAPLEMPEEDKDDEEDEDGFELSSAALKKFETPSKPSVEALRRYSQFSMHSASADFAKLETPSRKAAPKKPFVEEAPKVVEAVKEVQEEVKEVKETKKGKGKAAAKKEAKSDESSESDENKTRRSSRLAKK